jgi:hypothetical protein
MTLTLHLLFAVLALVCFGLAAAGVPSRINLTALGLAFLTVMLAFA